MQNVGIRAPFRFLFYHISVVIVGIRHNFVHSNVFHRYTPMTSSILSTVSLRIKHNFFHRYTPMTSSIIFTVSLYITHTFVHRYTPMTSSILSKVSLEIKHNFVWYVCFTHSNTCYSGIYVIQ